MNDLNQVKSELSGCSICADRFQATATRHTPRPVVWFQKDARILIAGQAPGMRVHQSGVPFDDPSGDRLRDWMGLDRNVFYDQARVAILPMAFCFPGYDAKKSDLPPPPVCAETWRARIVSALGSVRLTLLVGGYSQRWHLGMKSGVTETVKEWRKHSPETIPLPHPSWRNTSWIKKNPWFETDLLPELKTRVNEALS